jgi:hypothetical protein
MKKSLGIISILATGMIFTVALVAMIIVPLLVLKVHLIENVQIQIGYSNAELSLLTMMSSGTEDNPTQEKLSNYVVFGDEGDLDAVRGKLDLIFDEGECFLLTAGDEVLVQGDCPADRYSAEIKIPLPYNPDSLAEKITMVMN